MAEDAISVNLAQARRWRDLLERLDCWVLIYGAELPAEGWDDLAEELDTLAPGITRDVETVRAAGNTALIAHPDLGGQPASTATERPQAADTAQMVAEQAAPTEERAPSSSSSEPLAGEEPAPTEDDPDSATSAQPLAGEELSPAEEPNPAPTLAHRAAPVRPGRPELTLVLGSAEAGSTAIATPTGPAGAKPMRWVDIAVTILERAGKEMNAKEILAYSLVHGPSRPVTGKTPTQTINRDLHNAIRKGHPTLRHGASAGTFTLAR